MSSESYYLNCMDPGGDTGLALLHIGPEDFRLVRHATVQWRPDRGDNPATTLGEWRAEFPGTHHLVYESFHLRNTASAASTDVTAISVIEAVKDLTASGNLYEEVLTQQPAEAKHMATDKVLESLDLHLGHKHAQRHVRDALRHGVTLLVKRRYLPVCKAAFPRRSVRTPSLHPGSRR